MFSRRKSPVEELSQLARHSPCIGICKLDDATGYCLGCGRTGAEVGDWMAMSESQRDAVWAVLPRRLAQLSARVRLLPWVHEELVDWVRDSIVGRQGTWAVGAPAATAEFGSWGTAPINVRVAEGTIIAELPDAAFRLRITDKVRAFAFDEGGPIVLGLPKGRAALPSLSAVGLIGPDAAAIDQDERGSPLFDMGIGQRYSRFCLRPREHALAEMLAEHIGHPSTEAWTRIQPRLQAADFVHVVESSAARIEVVSNGARSESGSGGAEVHVVPELLKSGDEIAPNLAPPDYAAPIAIFRPASTLAERR